MATCGRDLLLRLPSPEYMPAPELLITSLAWRLVDKDRMVGWIKDSKNKPKALAYELSKKTSLKDENVLWLATKPVQNAEDVSKWRSLLRENNIDFDSNQDESSTSILDALRGGEIKGSARRTTSPLTPHVSLLQNGRGVYAKKGPPDIGLTLETIFALGRPAGNLAVGAVDIENSAAALWYKAMAYRLHDDPRLNQIDQSIKSYIKTHPENADWLNKDHEIFQDESIFMATYAVDAKSFSQICLGEDTPFAWFADMWQRITSNTWVNALPARRWMDWATTVLRMAFGFAYIWEANWYLAIASAVTDPLSIPVVEEKCLIYKTENSSQSEVVGVQFILRSPRLRGGSALSWKDDALSITLRDIAPSLRQTLHQGREIRNILKRGIDEGSNKSVEETLFDLRQDSEICDELRRAQTSKFTRSSKSTWEAVKYALLIRKSEGEAADFYGLLKSRNRNFTVIEPATEWTAALASLAINNPGGVGTLKKVKEEFERLGLRTSVGELRRNLEAAGLAQSTADADTAVVVESAF